MVTTKDVHGPGVGPLLVVTASANDNEIIANIHRTTETIVQTATGCRERRRQFPPSIVIFVDEDRIGDLGTKIDSANDQGVSVDCGRSKAIGSLTPARF
ncbi:MAG TPA: hypothetical protein QGF05_03625 [Dehalococcoidia bacterium]|nr:hypothetical protein [Dehalococcoidia bacterium]